MSDHLSSNHRSRQLLAMAEALEKRGGGWQAEIDNLRGSAAEIERLTAELERQCLLLGKSGSREATMLAAINHWKVENARLRAALEKIASTEWSGLGSSLATVVYPQDIAREALAGPADETTAVRVCWCGHIESNHKAGYGCLLDGCKCQGFELPSQRAIREHR